MAAGRPTKLTNELIFMAEQYLHDYNEELKQAVPSIVGLCNYINVSKSTVYKWKEENKSQIFSDTLERIEEEQCIKLINGGLSSTLNPTITKLMLANHGYSEKVQQDHTSSDGSMTPRNTLEDFYATDSKS